MSSQIISNPDVTDEEAIKTFLLDIDCLEKLAPWTNKFNLFDVLKISKMEIRHSNMLAWLLNPNENHNLKDYFLRGLLETITTKINLNNISVFDILLMNFYDFKVQREWKHIDLLLTSENSKIVICIENKIYSSEHDNQLNRYKKIVDEHYASYKKFFLYLTPHGDNASDSDTWINISYSELLKLLNKSISKTILYPDVEILIKNYIDTVRWHIVGDEKLIKICTEIYQKHKKTLDLIYENKPDNIQEVSNFILKYLSTQTKNESIHLNTQKSTKTYIRFTTNTMSELLPNYQTETSGWKTSNFYFYEITYRDNDIKLQLSLSRGNLTKEEYTTFYQKIFRASNITDLKPNWSWKTVKSWNILKLGEESLEALEYKLLQKLEDVLYKLSTYEKELVEKINKLNF